MSRSEILCRICVKEKSPMISILENNPLNIQDKLKKLLKIKVSENSELPKQICLDCLTKLNNFNEFYVQCNENQVILQVLFNEKPESTEAVTSPRSNSEISTQTDQPKTSQERYFIIEELTETGNETQQISIVTEDELSQEVREDDQFDITIEHDNIKSENTSLKDVKDFSISSLNSSTKKRNRFDRFDCYLCQEQLTGNFLFLKHFSTDHPKQEIRYQCYICKSYVKKYRSYTRHLESHDERRFECDICNQKFSQKTTLVTHLSSHSTIKKYECTDCNLSFKQNSSLFKHRKQKHSNLAPTCQLCNRNFVNNETLKQHIKSKHNMHGKDIGCEECDKKFASRSALAYHKLSNHSKNDLQTVKCDNCQEVFKNKIILGRHEKKCSK